ncbi:hypothetical protein ACQPZG_01475 (plasmid) [Streptomyces sp. CA-294286]|uniref:hypothetical protein n=1 Tax=Streptomyces sp. CA-294286 TaxID=3240070 RepID=UPI003D8F3F84
MTENGTPEPHLDGPGKAGGGRGLLAFAVPLATAGLNFHGMADDAAPLVPATVAGFANCVAPADGARFVSVESSDPQVREKANAQWYELGRDLGLFGGTDGRFLVAVDLDEQTWPRARRWAVVSLADTWDVMGTGAAGVLGAGYLLPGFVMQSLGGEVVVRGDTWESEIGAAAVRHPHRVPVLRARATAAATGDDLYQRAAAKRWLDAYPHPGTNP